MPAKLIISPQYKSDRAKILDSIVNWSFESGNDPKAYLQFFRKDEADLQSRIKNSPLSAGVTFPVTVRKATSASGKYVILYTLLPPDAQTNPDVKQANLDSILPTASYSFNSLIKGFAQADLDE